MWGAAPRVRRHSLAALAAALLAVLAGAAGPQASARSLGTVLMGDQQVASGNDQNAPGTAEAFSMKAVASGTVSSISVYVDATSSATKLVAGLYADGGGHPGALLTQGSLSAPAAGAWNTVAVSAASVSSGSTYWLALLGPSGTLRFRDHANAGGPNETSAQSTLTSLPSSWATGIVYHDSPPSAYATAADPVAPSTPTGLAASGATQTSLNLSWQPSTGNVGGYDVSRNGVHLFDASSPSASVSGLSCGTAYTFGVRAFDPSHALYSGTATVSASTSSCSTSSGGSTTGGSTPPPPPPPPSGDTQAPSVPTGFARVGATKTSIAVGWNPSTDNVGVAGYSLYRGTKRVGSSSATMYTYTGLRCGHSYNLGVDAYDAAGNRSAKATVRASTRSCTASADTQAPTVPANLHVTSASASSVSVAWSASSDNVGVAGYGAYKNGTRVASTASTGYTFAGLACGTSYTVAVDAYDASGNRSAKASVQASTSACAGSGGDTQAPSAPSNLKLSASTTTSVSVSWSPSTDNVGVAGYSVYKNGVVSGSTSSLAYTVAGLACGSSYTVAVDAYDAAGNRSAKASFTASTAACAPAGDTQAPSVPSSFRIASAAQTSLSVSWGASTDNVGVAGYGLYKNGASTGSTAATSYTYSGLACGTSYTFAVDAYDAAGNRSGQASVSGATSACSTSSSGASVYLSPSGSDSSSCSSSAPCRSFQRGYDVAQPGQVVQVAGGSYGNQTVNGSKSAPKVVFQPAVGASVSLSDLEVYADNVEFRNMTTGFWATHAASDGATLRNIDTGPFIIYGSSNTSVIGGDVGPSYGNGNATNDAFITYDNGTTAPTNVLLDGVYFHDFKLGYVGDHGQCIQVVGGNGLTFRNNRFQRCDGYSIFFTQWAGPAPPQNILMENNFFDKSTNYGSYTTCCTYYAVQFAAHMSYFKNITLRNNSFLQLVSFERGPSVSNVQMIANIAPMDVCVSGVVYAYNVFNGPKCGTTDKSAAVSFVDSGSLNLHLPAGSAAINAGDPASYPSTDIDGQGRPMGGAPDAGADESG